MQVQFRTGQTESFLAVIIVREHLDSIFPSAPLYSAKLQTQPIHCFRRERGEERGGKPIVSMLTKSGIHP